MRGENEFKEIKWGYFDQYGKQKIPYRYSNTPKPFSSGRAVIQTKDGFYGYIDTLGNIVVETNFKSAFSFIDNFAIVLSQDHSWQIIDKSGKIFNTITAEISNYSFQVVDIDKTNKMIKFSNGTNEGYLNDKGEIIVNPIFKNISLFNTNRATCLYKNQWVIINQKGEILAIKKDSNL